MNEMRTGGSEPAADALTFILDGEVHALRGVDPNRTLLEFLREDLARTGTKEGCAEGDCGACTVVLGEADGERVRLRAVNSCIKLLPTLDGKELFTVESLRAADGTLHPVQRAMVESHGSQCGFCTPGFVMSLFALYKSEPSASRQRILDALAGNLCRCTGYRPIVDAASAMYAAGDPRHPEWLQRPGSAAEPAADERERAVRLRTLARRDTLTLRGRSALGRERVFHAPRTLAALAALVEENPDARLLAGGTDVGLWVTKAHRDLDLLIYTGEVEELRRLEVVGDRIEIGAAVTVTDALELLAEHHPDLGEVYRRFGSPPIRNVATIGGNVANGSPIGDSMPGFIALGATLVLRRGAATREMPLEDFYVGYQRTALAPGELVERVRVPVGDPARRFANYKVSKRFDQDISAVCGAFALRFDGGVARDVRACFGGMAATPRRARRCEAALEGRAWDGEALAAGMAALDDDYQPISDQRASAGYRATVARNLLRRFYLESGAAAPATRVLSHGG
jgi:xanthine dehydrogenase small subunit